MALLSPGPATAAPATAEVPPCELVRSESFAELDAATRGKPVAAARATTLLRLRGYDVCSPVEWVEVEQVTTRPLPDGAYSFVKVAVARRHAVVDRGCGVVPAAHRPVWYQSHLPHAYRDGPGDSCDRFRPGHLVRGISELRSRRGDRPTGHQRHRTFSTRLRAAFSVWAPGQTAISGSSAPTFPAASRPSVRSPWFPPGSRAEVHRSAPTPRSPTVRAQTAFAWKCSSTTMALVHLLPPRRSRRIHRSPVFQRRTGQVPPPWGFDSGAVAPRQAG